MTDLDLMQTPMLLRNAHRPWLQTRCHQRSQHPLHKGRALLDGCAGAFRAGEVCALEQKCVIQWQ